MKITVTANAIINASVEIDDSIAPENVIARVIALLENDRFSIDTDTIQNAGITRIEVGDEAVYEGDAYGLPLVDSDPAETKDHPHIRALRNALGEQWVTFTRRTEYPKLGWVIDQLEQIGIPCRLSGRSMHAPILEVRRKHLDAAWEILDPLDDVEDDHRMFAGFELRIPTLT